jgi:hypothetical protein
MAPAPGTRLGAHEIVGLLGAGGMGEVYRAVDTRLDRQVAIKILPEAVRADPERTARFEREAKLLASLNHSNIAGIYGLEAHVRVPRGHDVIVMRPTDSQNCCSSSLEGYCELDSETSGLPVRTRCRRAIDSSGGYVRQVTVADRSVQVSFRREMSGGHTGGNTRRRHGLG